MVKLVAIHDVDHTDIMLRDDAAPVSATFGPESRDHWVTAPKGQWEDLEWERAAERALVG